MSGRAATDRVIRGRFGISVNDPGHPTPSGWTRTPLTDVADLGTGHTPSRNHPEYWDGDVPWIGIRDAGAHHGGIIDTTNQTITPLGLANSAARLLPKDTVCLSRTASVGYVVKMGRDMATSQDFVNWVCSEALDPDFLMSALLAEGEDIRKFGEGSTHTTIYFPAVKAFHIDLPPVTEQLRIVAKLDALTARITRARVELNRVPTLVGRYKAQLLQLAFEGALTLEWRRGHLVKTSEALAAVRAVRATSSRLMRRKLVANLPETKIPESWEWISPDEIASDERYSIGIGPFGSNLVRSDYTDHGTRLVFVRDIRRERFDEEDAKYVSEEKTAELHQHIAKPRDVLITKMGDPPGDVSLFPEDAPPAIITADCIKISPHEKLVRSKFLYFCIRSPQVQAQFKAITAGVAQQKVSLDRFRQIALPIAPLEEQAEIIIRIEAAFAHADRLEAEVARARKLLDRLESAILAKAFRGELVPQDPNDEPASMLLERVRAQRAAAPKAPRGRKARA